VLRFASSLFRSFYLCVNGRPAGASGGSLLCRFGTSAACAARAACSPRVLPPSASPPLPSLLLISCTGSYSSLFSSSRSPPLNTVPPSVLSLMPFSAPQLPTRLASKTRCFCFCALASCLRIPCVHVHPPQIDAVTARCRLANHPFRLFSFLFLPILLPRRVSFPAHSLIAKKYSQTHTGALPSTGFI